MSTSHNTLSYLETKGLQQNALIAELERNFPPLNPHPTETTNAIMYKAGQRTVVEWVINYIEDN